MADNFDKSAILGSFLDEVDAYIPEIETHLDQLQQIAGSATGSTDTGGRRTGLTPGGGSN